MTRPTGCVNPPPAAARWVFVRDLADTDQGVSPWGALDALNALDAPSTPEYIIKERVDIILKDMEDSKLTTKKYKPTELALLLSYPEIRGLYFYLCTHKEYFASVGLFFEKKETSFREYIFYKKDKDLLGEPY
jgi:hypothetical protein